MRFPNSVTNVFQSVFRVKYIVRRVMEVCKSWMPCFCVNPYYLLLLLLSTKPCLRNDSYNTSMGFISNL